MAEQHPVVGVGLGRYPRLMAAYGGGPMRENTHNLFLQMLAEAGLIGFGAFAFLCTSILLALGRGVMAARNDDGARAVALGALMGTLAFLLTLLTGHALLLPSGQILFAGFVALTLTIASEPGAPGAAASARGSTWRRALAAGLVVGIAVIAPAVGVARGISPRTGPWGYVSGLHDEERPATGEPYRWTPERAMLDLAVPEGATALVVRVTTVYPMRDGVPTQVRLTMADTTTDLVFTSSDVQTVRLPLSAGTRRVVVSVVVSPTFVPPAGSGDPRVLGVQLLLPQFEVAAAAPRR
jgi:hypothetical protein